ncbi:MAG: pitrilysin family protein [Reyranellaceae bacterium]
MRRLLALLAVVLVALPALAHAVDIRTVKTPLGLTAWLVQDKSAPAVSVAFSFGAGAASDPAGQSGVTSLMATLLTDGAGAFDARTFRLRQEEAGASVSFSASLDRLGGSLRVLSANRDDGFELLRLALVEPRFDLDMLEQRRAQTIAALNQATQRPGSVANRTLMTTEFAGHPYAKDTEGTVEDLKALTPDLVRARAKALLMRSGLVISAVGDIDEATLAELLDRTFGALPQGTPPVPPPDWTPPGAARTVVVERPVPQSTALLALPGILRDDPDWYAALLLNHVLGGGGQHSRLFTEVREKRGLAYGASSGLRTWRKAGLLVISTASANDRVAQALEVVRGEIARLRREGPSEAEFEDARTYLTGALALSLDSSGAIASLLHSMQIDGLPPDHLERRAALIDKVTLADVRRVGERLLREELLLTVVVGKPVGVSPSAAP